MSGLIQHPLQALSALTSGSASAAIWQAPCRENGKFAEKGAQPDAVQPISKFYHTCTRYLRDAAENRVEALMAISEMFGSSHRFEGSLVIRTLLTESTEEVLTCRR